MLDTGHTHVRLGVVAVAVVVVVVVPDQSFVSFRKLPEIEIHVGDLPRIGHRKI